MWTPADRALVGSFGSGQVLTDDQFRLLEPLIPPAKPGGRPRTTNIRNLLDGLFYLVRTGCQWRHLLPLRLSRRGAPSRWSVYKRQVLLRPAWLAGAAVAARAVRD